METVAQMQDVNIDKIIIPTISAFVPLLEKNKDAILGTPKQTFHYGETDRHQLDIYYPIDSAEGQTAPILFYSYGGGFVSGGRNYPPPYELGYSCLGSYFARQGFITVIPDYRLVPHVVFPQPAEDVRDAIAWVIKHPEHLTMPYTPTPKPDLESLYLMGHSAGAAHVATVLLLPELLDNTDLRTRVKGVVLLGGPYSFKDVTPDDGSADVLEQYFGSLDKARENCALSLLERTPSKVVQSIPKVLMLEAEHEPPFLYTRGLHQFPKTLEEKIGSENVERAVAKGHNHISPLWALSSGQGEEWGEKVVDWIKADQ